MGELVVDDPLLKWITKEQEVTERIGLDIRSKTVAGSCEYDNGFSGFIKGGGVPDQLSDCLVLKKYSFLP